METEKKIKLTQKECYRLRDFINLTTVSTLSPISRMTETQAQAVNLLGRDTEFTIPHWKIIVAEVAKKQQIVERENKAAISIIDKVWDNQL
jgi:hypothetical protein